MEFNRLFTDITRSPIKLTDLTLTVERTIKAPQADENQIPHSGTYREIVPNNRIVFTWESPYSVDDSTVTLTFVSTPGGTRVTLPHVRFVDAATRDNHGEGWANILEAFETLLD